VAVGEIAQGQQHEQHGQGAEYHLGFFACYLD